MNVTLQILIDVFFSLLLISMLIYSTIFFIYKSLFRKQLTLMKKWNELSLAINTLNITRLNILANNNFNLKQDINNLIRQLNNVKHELEVIFKNIEIIQDLVSKISISIAKKYMKICKNDLQLCSDSLNEITNKYNAYCCYSDTIANSLDDVIELFESSKTFFENNIFSHANYSSIINLFNIVSNNINDLSKLIITFDFKATINLWSVLSANLQRVTNLILDLYKFQIVDNYLVNDFKKYKNIITKSCTSITNDDLNRLDNTMNNFEQYYDNFVHAYKQLDFVKANDLMVKAINQMCKISHFVLISVYANNIIKNGLDEFALQTKTILSNQDQIINTVDMVGKYFSKNVQIINWLSLIKKNVKDIVVIAKRTKELIYSEFDKKLIVMNSLAKYSTEIWQKKKEIISLIDNVNSVFDKVITNIRQINNLYVCYWQLLNMLNNFVPNGPEFYQINNLIKNNLDKVNSWFDKIVHNSEDINHQTLNLHIANSIDNFSYLYKKIISHSIFQNYAANLMIYANRYRTSNNQSIFDDVKKLYEQKQFIACIDKLISICHKKY